MQKLFFGWTEDRVKYLRENGKIRGYTDARKNIPHKNKKNIPTIPKRSKEKDWLDWNLMFWANEHALEMQTEHKFHPERDWRLDYAFEAVKIAVEYEGIFKKDKSTTGHNSISGVMRDIEKYNQAQLLGWKVIRVTANNYTTVLEQLNKLLDAG